MPIGDSTDSSSISEAVYQTIAEHEEVPATELTQPLYEVIDPDALDRLFRGDTGHLSFEFHGWTVTVDHSGFVTTEAVGGE